MKLVREDNDEKAHWVMRLLIAIEAECSTTVADDVLRLIDCISAVMHHQGAICCGAPVPIETKVAKWKGQSPGNVLELVTIRISDFRSSVDSVL